MYIFEGDWKPKFRTSRLLHFEWIFVTLETERENSADPTPFFCAIVAGTAAAASSPSIFGELRGKGKAKRKKAEGECEFLSLGSLTVITVEVAQESS